MPPRGRPPEDVRAGRAASAEARARWSRPRSETAQAATALRSASASGRSLGPRSEWRRSREDRRPPRGGPPTRRGRCSAVPRSSPGSRERRGGLRPEGRLHGRHRLQDEPLAAECLPYARPRHGAGERIQEPVGALIEGRLEAFDLAPVALEQVAEAAAERPHTPLGLALVAPLPWAAGIDLEAAFTRKDRIGAVQDRTRTGPLRHAGLEIVDPHPERHAAVATEELEVTRVPGELVGRAARPRKARPAVRERADEHGQEHALTSDRRPDLEPIMLRLHARGRLDPTQGPQLRYAVGAPKMPDHGLVAAAVAVVPCEEVIDSRSE